MWVVFWQLYHTYKHTHTHARFYACAYVYALLWVCVCFLYSLLATHICVAWRVEFSVVCKYMKCLFVGGVRTTYVCTWRLWRNKWPLLPQHQNLQHQQKAKLPHCACLEHSTGWQTTTKHGKTTKPIQQTNRLQFQFALFLIRQIFLISTAVGNLVSPLPKVIRVEVFFISCMYACVCVYFCC